jgi:glycosyltransferase involved in cell wall biosynthesis
MKVLFDHQTFSVQTYGGISRTFYELIKAYNSDAEVEADLSTEFTPNQYLHSDADLKSKYNYDYPQSNEILPKLKFKGKSRLSRALGVKGFDYIAQNKFNTIEKLKKGDFDVFHPTYYDPYFLDYLNGKPFVITFLDLIHEMYPELMMWDKSYVPRREIAEKASKIIAISEVTKNDIVEIYNIDPAKIEVIHLASSLNTSLVNDNLKLPEKYLLFVGNRELYKNFYFMARVFAALSKEDPELHLVCAGGGKFKPVEEEYLKILGIENKVVFAGSDDATIATCYRKAKAFITPSLYEGFNIPIVEAFSSGCPVLASNAGPSPEVGGDAVEYFSPKDFGSMKTAIRNVVYDEKRREKLISKGMERSKLYSWERTAKLTKDVYKSLI